MGRAKRPLFSLSPERRNELWGVLLFAGSLLLLMSLISYHPDDLSFFTSHPSAPVRNLCGVVGAAVAGMVHLAIGLTGYVLAALGFLWAAGRFNGRIPQRPAITVTGTILFCLATSSLLSLVWVPAPEARVHRGGVLGYLLGNQMLHYFGWWGAVVVLFSIGLLCLLLSTEMEVWPMVAVVGKGFKALVRFAGDQLEQIEGLIQKRRPVLHRSGGASPTKERPPLVKIVKPPAPELPLQEKVAARAVVKEESRPPVDRPAAKADFQLPSLDLLDPPSASQQAAHQSREWLEKNAKVLEESLREFGIEAKVAEVEMGPVITRYEVEPAPGVKVQKITTLADDLALVMKAPSVRIIAPIPGKARVGIEVPNPASSMVILREVLESTEFREFGSKLALALGKDAAGHPLLADLSEMPHLLIAGTTGSGKTVCVNSLITAILFNATPEEVRFIMVDPKMVELSVFNGIPHLVLPVLTNPKQVPVALSWVVGEMETRYRLFAKLGVRNIEGYHEKRAAGQFPAEEIPSELPYLIVIIDELADLMLVAQAEVERAIGRLAHLSRAVGIHMVLATQRPSVDVLTGVIKANFPARISFQVASRVDSRTVLDTIGAEKLLGKGDLLFLQPGSSRLIRGQGTFVSDQEIERVVQFLKAQRAPEYDTSILQEETRSTEGLVTVKDPLYPEAVRIVVESGQASVSLLQRRMRLGYGRAARILDRMEQEGIVGPIRGAKPREVYLKEVPENDELVDRRTSQIGA